MKYVIENIELQTKPAKLLNPFLRLALGKEHRSWADHREFEKYKRDMEQKAHFHRPTIF